MSICPDCGAKTVEPDDHMGPGVAVLPAGRAHLRTCPQVPQLTVEAKARLRDGLADIERARKEAHVRSQFYVVGGEA